jgi:phage-related protein
MPLLTFPYSFGPTTSAQKSTEAKTLRAEFGDGYTQRVADGLNSVRDTYSVSWEDISRTDARLIDDFLRARGGFEAFLWTPPGATVSKKWICESWSVTNASTVLDSVSATFVEVFDL